MPKLSSSGDLHLGAVFHFSLLAVVQTMALGGSPTHRHLTHARESDPR